MPLHASSSKIESRPEAVLSYTLQCAALMKVCLRIQSISSLIDSITQLNPIPERLSQIREETPSMLICSMKRQDSFCTILASMRDILEKDMSLHLEHHHQQPRSHPGHFHQHPMAQLKPA